MVESCDSLEDEFLDRRDILAFSEDQFFNIFEILKHCGAPMVLLNVFRH